MFHSRNSRNVAGPLVICGMLQEESRSIRSPVGSEWCSPAAENRTLLVAISLSNQGVKALLLRYGKSGFINKDACKLQALMVAVGIL